MCSTDNNEDDSLNLGRSSMKEGGRYLNLNEQNIEVADSSQSIKLDE